ncbi:MAG TPA: DUF6027 family protein [Acidimicrobiales bacterium]|nr:DUF6027 family protein [Acidimicrobiales bacterium]
MTPAPGRTVDIRGWNGVWETDDPDANFKHEVALYAHADPIDTLQTLSTNLGIPIGGLVHYVLARWASDGSATLLALGPDMVERMAAKVDDAEAVDTDAARLEAYDALRQMIGWLRLPLDDG